MNLSEKLKVDIECVESKISLLLSIDEEMCNKVLESGSDFSKARYEEHFWHKVIGERVKNLRFQLHQLKQMQF